MAFKESESNETLKLLASACINSFACTLIAPANDRSDEIAQLEDSGYGEFDPSETWLKNLDQLMAWSETVDRFRDGETKMEVLQSIDELGLPFSHWAAKVRDEIVIFLAERLKVALREKGTRHDLIDAVFSIGNEDDLVRLVARVEALQTFLKSDDGTNLLIAYKRAANILKAEEKKDKTEYSGNPDPKAFVVSEEKALFVELSTAAELIRAEVERERFVEAMGVMARLRKPVDAFFDKVTVNDKDPALRKNRLLLLSRLRATLHLVADFSKIEG